MTEESYHQLISYLKSETGELLRGVITYDSDEYEIHYIRDDIRTQHLKNDVNKIIKRLRRESRPSEHRSFPFGELNGIVRSFENAMVMHFPDTQGRGTVVTLEPEVARQLNTFLGNCLQRME
ncbi:MULTISPECIES: hypothetical protein [Halorussus]|uniref:hypothetical protein n=1 Tax=Halorussus TaxID=1070314 RepID=UPI00209E635B|nr:hypothetical protein [Halorussus vallis]USZ78704.1 hypothetical protein NGM07_24650 [Halorussus vallis]